MSKVLGLTGKGEWVAVDSSNITALSYDSGTKILMVLFKKAKDVNVPIWMYKNVEQAAFDGLMGAESIGKEFNSNVKTAPGVETYKLLHAQWKD